MAYLGILVSAEDFSLLVKKYGKNSYTINYIAFVAAINEAVNYMEQHGMLDLGGVSIFILVCIKLKHDTIGRIKC